MDMAIENDISPLGRAYRFFTALFPIDSKRKGKCKRCGACCQKANCKFLEFDYNGKAYCPVRKYRPLQCRKYPRTKKELFTHKTCGYKFRR